jgi:uncharacterized membrane protein YeaQ/YmgE (transglycosylase-associated protein family)
MRRAFFLVIKAALRCEVGLPPIFGVTANGWRGRENGAYAPSFRSWVATAAGRSSCRTLLIWIIIIARILSPGPNELGGFILTTALGIAGASSQLLSAKLSVGIGSIRVRGSSVATVGSLLVLFVWNRFVATRATAAGDIREPGSSPRRWL